MLYEILYCMRIGWYIGLGFLIIALLLTLVEKLVACVRERKDGRLNWYTIMFDDGDYTFAAHNEMELVFKIQSLLYLRGKNFIIYKMPYKDCCDVSQWELIMDDVLPDAEVEGDEKK